MLPDFALNNIMDSRCVNGIFRRKRRESDATGSIAGANVNYLRSGQFGIPVLSTARRAFRMLGQAVALTNRLAAFGDHVRCISGIRTQEQVIGPDAELFVAFMKDAQSWRNGSAIQKIAVAMGRYCLLAPGAETAIATTTSGGPEPASIRLRAFGDVRPKPANDVGAAVSVAASLATKTAFAARGRNKKARAAVLAFALNLWYTSHVFGSYKLKANPRTPGRVAGTSCAYYTTSRARAHARAVL